MKNRENNNTYEVRESNTKGLVVKITLALLLIMAVILIPLIKEQVESIRKDSIIENSEITFKLGEYIEETYLDNTTHLFSNVELDVEAQEVYSPRADGLVGFKASLNHGQEIRVTEGQKKLPIYYSVDLVNDDSNIIKPDNVNMNVFFEIYNENGDLVLESYEAVIPVGYVRVYTLELKEGLDKGNYRIVVGTRIYTEGVATYRLDVDLIVE